MMYAFDPVDMKAPSASQQGDPRGRKGYERAATLGSVPFAVLLGQTVVRPIDDRPRIGDEPHMTDRNTRSMAKQKEVDVQETQVQLGQVMASLVAGEGEPAPLATIDSNKTLSSEAAALLTHVGDVASSDQMTAEDVRLGTQATQRWNGESMATPPEETTETGLRARPLTAMSTVTSAGSGNNLLGKGVINRSAVVGDIGEVNQSEPDGLISSGMLKKLTERPMRSVQLSHVGTEPGGQRLNVAPTELATEVDHSLHVVSLRDGQLESTVVEALDTEPIQADGQNAHDPHLLEAQEGETAHDSSESVNRLVMPSVLDSRSALDAQENVAQQAAPTEPEQEQNVAGTSGVPHRVDDAPTTDVVDETRTHLTGRFGGASDTAAAAAVGYEAHAKTRGEEVRLGQSGRTLAGVSEDLSGEGVKFIVENDDVNDDGQDFPGHRGTENGRKSAKVVPAMTGDRGPDSFVTSSSSRQNEPHVVTAPESIVQNSESQVAPSAPQALTRAEAPAEQRTMSFVPTAVPAEPEHLGEVIRSVALESVNEVQTVRVELHPRHLGRLEITVAVEQGGVTAQIVAGAEGTRQMIESSLPELRQVLLSQGMDVDSITVSVGGGGHSDQPHDWSGHERHQGTPARGPVRAVAVAGPKTGNARHLDSDSAIDVLA